MSDKPVYETFRSSLLTGEQQIGTFLKTPTVHATEILGGLGFDFMVIDAEHAPLDRVVLDQMVLASRAANTAAVIRVPYNDKAAVMAALDMGAAGILYPHVTSAEMAKEFVATSRFVGGERGFSPSTRAGGYGSRPMWDFVEHCDSITTVIAMIEDVEAVENIEEIVAVEGLDAVFIGRGDLTISYKSKSPVSDELKAALIKVVEATKAAGKAALTITPGGEDAKWLSSLGVTGFIVASDQGFMKQAASKCLEGLRELK